MITKSLKDKVLYCLEKYEESRGNDVKLCNALWIEYYSSYIRRDQDNNLYIRLIDLYNVPSQDDIIRYRRVIQNKEGLFKPSIEIQKKRLEAECLSRGELGYPSAPINKLEQTNLL